ncbi:MAG: hypothetical protein LBH19_01410 [Dysgonamonadaceae bacterium]|jgi:hypothetical protein|nr:hypothetical protein [Dysgonamonadaceae bacterium]
MIPKETIQQVTDHLLQNIKTANVTGLYNGKAGLSLALFIAATHLQDEHIEDVSFNILKESLVFKNYDLSFENGLAGIGYALLFLIENKYLDADFDEIFGEQYEMIIKGLETIEKDPLKLLNSLQVIYFLTKAGNIKKEDGRIRKMIKRIFEGLELFLSVQFHDFSDIHYINKKADVLNMHKIYLKLVDYSGYIHFSNSLLEDYAALYRKGRVVSSLETGFYLRNIAARHDITIYDDIITENINNGMNNLYLDTLSLKERIDSAKIVSNIQYKDDKEYNMLLNFENLRKGKEIQDLLKTVDGKSYPLGYGAGVGRFLIYCVNKHIELL